MTRRYPFFILTCLLFCMSSCRDVTHVQMGYISDRDDCRSRAENGVGSYTSNASNISGKDKNSMLLQLFCECMKDREWNVAGCKRKEIEVAKPEPKQQPTIVVVQSPPAVVAPPPEPAACPAPVKKGKKRPKRRIDGTCPAPEEYGQNELDNVLNKQ